jgi:hypothetical protein
MASFGTQSQYKPGAGFAPSPPDWLMASLGAQSQYKPGAGFASLALILASDALTADAKGQPSETQHRLLIQVNQNDPAMMNLALNRRGGV